MELDLNEGKITVRPDLIYELNDLVTRKQMKAIKGLRDKHNKLEQEGIDKLSQEELDNIEDEWFGTVLPLGLKNFKKEDMDMLTEGEIRELTASVYVFLTKFGSTALAKQFVSATKEMNENEQKP